MDKFSFLLSYFSFVLNEKKKIDKFITYPGYSAILLLPSFNHPDYKFKLSRVNRTNEEDRKPTPFALFYFFFLLTATRVFIINFPIHVKLIAQKKKKTVSMLQWQSVSQSIEQLRREWIWTDGTDGTDGRMTDAIGIAPRTRARSRARLMPRFLSLVKAAKILAQDSTQLELNCVIHMTCHDTPPLPVPRSNHLRKKIKYRVGRRSSIHPSISRLSLEARFDCSQLS